MVKGIAKHAVIVKSPDMKDFEQAIFIVSGQPDHQQVDSPAEMLNLACDLASKYTVKSKQRAPRWLVPMASFLAGTGLTGAVWMYFTLFVR